MSLCTCASPEDESCFKHGRENKLITENADLTKELSILKNPSDGRCMSIHALRERNAQLSKEIDELLLVQKFPQSKVESDLRAANAQLTEELASYKKIVTADEVRAGEIAGEGNKLIKCAERHVWLKGYRPNCPFCEKVAQLEARVKRYMEALENVRDERIISSGKSDAMEWKMLAMSRLNIAIEALADEPRTGDEGERDIGTIPPSHHTRCGSKSCEGGLQCFIRNN